MSLFCTTMGSDPDSGNDSKSNGSVRNLMDLNNMLSILNKVIVVTLSVVSTPCRSPGPSSFPAQVGIKNYDIVASFILLPKNVKF